MKTSLLAPCAALLLAGCAQKATTTTTTTASNTANGQAATTQTKTTTTTRDTPANGAASDAATRADAQAAREPVRGFVRALHAVPGAGRVSVVADAQKLSGVDYGDASPFGGVRAKNVKISAFGGDGKKIAGPMPLALDGGEDVTVLVTGIPGDIVLLPWKHKNYGPKPGQAKIAFVHSAKSLPAVDLRLDGASFRRNVKFGVATDYTTLAPGRHRVQVVYDRSLAPQVVEVESPTIITKDPQGNVVDVSKAAPTRTRVPRAELVTLTQEIDLAAGKVYSLAVFAGAGKAPKVRLMEDRFAPELAGETSADANSSR